MIELKAKERASQKYYENLIAKSGFSPQQIHNTNNLIIVDNATHAKISIHS